MRCQDHLSQGNVPPMQVGRNLAQSALLLCLAPLLGCKQGYGQPCVKSEECGTALLCVRWRCGTGADADCQATAACAEVGLCAASDGKCVAKLDADCRPSKRCLVHGGCTARDSKCLATTNDACRASEQCLAMGRCTALDGKCVATSDADCRAATLVDEAAWTARDGKCVTTDAGLPGVRVVPPGWPVHPPRRQVRRGVGRGLPHVVRLH